MTDPEPSETTRTRRPRSLRITTLQGLILSLLLAGCGPNSRLDPDLARLIAAKRAQAKELAAAQTNAVPGDVWKFFNTMERGDFRKATNVFERIRTNFRPADSYDDESKASGVSCGPFCAS
jgi:hypothetical protein